MKCTICRKEAKYFRFIEHNIPVIKGHVGGLISAARCKNCVDNLTQDR